MPLSSNEQVWELVQRLSGMTEEEQEAFWQEVSPEETALRVEVESRIKQAEERFSPNLWERIATDANATHRDLQPGQQINRYQIVKAIGEGGMGKVFLANDSRMNREVALKMLTHELSLKPKAVQRFEKEVRTAAALNHQNIMTVYDVGDDADRPYFTCEYIVGVTLRERLQTSGALAWQEVVAIAVQIADALQTAHRAKIIHRDIKPENLMLRDDGLVKVLDFGIAKSLDLAELNEEIHHQDGKAAVLSYHTNYTRTRGLLGTLSYMSPEQARGETLTPQTDIFSFGLVLHEMLTGWHPLKDKTPDQTLEELNSPQPFASLEEVCPEIPSQLIEVVNQAISKEKDLRFKTAASMWEALSELKAQTAAPSTTQPTQPAVTNNLPKLLRQQNANRLLSQFVVLAAERPGTLLSFQSWWTIWRSSDLKRRKLENELMRQSQRDFLRKYLAAGLLVAVVAVLFTLGVAAYFSIVEDWPERPIRDGHTAGVRRAVFSPDERLLVSVGEDHLVKVWDFAKRTTIKTMTDHTAEVVAVAFSPKGDFFATASWDQSVIIWDARTLEKVKTLSNLGGKVTAVAFSPDDKYLAIAVMHPNERTILWRTKTRERVREFPMSTGDWCSLVFSPTQPRMLYSGNMSVNVESDAPPIYLPWGTDVGYYPSFSRDGSLLLSAAGNGVQFRQLNEKIKLNVYNVHRDFGWSTLDELIYHIRYENPG
ncbi:MAG: protein kinase [Acidobacteria bacterium]|nr:protein kinase [Acidobacteriota bacterium]